MMSRNLAMTVCRQCECQVNVTGLPRFVETGDIRIVGADAECTVCGARYLAWISGPRSHKSQTDHYGGPFYDLSYRSTINDEPGPDDVPNVVEVSRIVKVNGIVVKTIPCEVEWPMTPTS